MTNSHCQATRSRVPNAPRLLATALSLISLLALSVPPALASEPTGPSIDSESVSHITEHDALLEAQIDPNGVYSAYEFQIDTNANHAFTQRACPFGLPDHFECQAIVVGEPLPPGLVEPQPEFLTAAFGDQSVSLDLASIGAVLRPATVYHYRVLASSGGPTEQGPDQTFTTLSGNPGTTGGGPAPNEVTDGQPAPPSLTVPPLEPSASSPPKPAATSVRAKPSPHTSKLARALERCRQRPKRERAACERLARREHSRAKHRGTS